MKFNVARTLTVISILSAFVALAACGGGGGSPANGGPPPALSYNVGGTVNGLAGRVVLGNGGEELTVAENGVFRFATPVARGAAYAVTVKTPPSFPAQNCTVADGSGAIGAADVTNVVITCTDLSAPVVQADAGVRSATLTWDTPAGAESFKIHISTRRGCDIDINSDAFCVDSTLLDATSPTTFTELRNGQAYFFQLETRYANGARELAREVGARPNTVAFDDAVYAIAPAAQSAPPTDGAVVYLGGSFTEVGISTGSGVPVDAITGRFASPDFSMVDGTVTVAVADGASGWFIGGSFRSVGGMPRNNVAHLFANGSVDPDWDVSIDGIVYALAVSGPTVYVGGDFNQVGLAAGSARNHLAAFDAKSGELEAWDPNSNGTVSVLVARDDTIYVSGIFTEVGGVPQAKLAAIHADTGAVLAQWAPQFEAPELPNEAVVFAICVSDDDRTVYVGGRFTKVGAANRSYLAAFLAPHAGGTGTATAWNPNAGDEVTALAISGNALYVGGRFQYFFDTDGTETRRDFLAALDATTAKVIEHWQPQPNSNLVSAIVVSPDGGTVYVGGPFGRIGSQVRRGLAAIDANGALLDWNPNANRAVRTLALSQGIIYAGGHFTSMGSSVARNHLAALDAKGALTLWNPRASGRVSALAVSAAGRVYAGGFFDAVGGALRNHLAELDANGVATPWNPNLDQSVEALTISGSAIYVGGTFSSVGGAPSIGLAAIDVTSARLTSDWQDPGVVGGVSAVAVDRGTLYAGGRFLRAGGVDRAGLAAFRADTGQLHLGWDPGLGGAAFALAVAHDTIYVGGPFVEVNRGGDTLRRNGLAAFPVLNEDGTSAATATAWNPDITGFGIPYVSTLAVRGQTIYAGGRFANVNSGANSLRRHNLAAFGTEGTATTWDPAPGGNVNFSGALYSVVVSGSTVYVSGDFTNLNGNARGGFGELEL